VTQRHKGSKNLIDKTLRLRVSELIISGTRTFAAYPRWVFAALVHPAAVIEYYHVAWLARRRVADFHLKTFDVGAIRATCGAANEPAHFFDAQYDFLFQLFHAEAVLGRGFEGFVWGTGTFFAAFGRQPGEESGNYQKREQKISHNLEIL
jgi:hypothetical protein